MVGLIGAGVPDETGFGVAGGGVAAELGTGQRVTVAALAIFVLGRAGTRGLLRRAAEHWQRGERAQAVEALERFVNGRPDSPQILDVIDQVGPGGHFLETDHTYQHFRANWVPKLLDRASREHWQMAGGLTMGDRVRARVQEIFETYQPEPLADDVSQVLDEVIQEAEERVK